MLMRMLSMAKPDDGIDDDSIEVDGQSDSEGDEMQTDSEEDLGSQYSVEI